MKLQGSDGEYSLCKSCGAKVVWVTTENGKKLILDREANDKGNIILFYDHKLGKDIAKVVKKNDFDYPHKARFISHWATCPDADQWRGSGNSGNSGNPEESGNSDPVMKKRPRPSRQEISITLDELRNLYKGARVRPSKEVTNVMLWLRGYNGS